MDSPTFHPPTAIPKMINHLKNIQSAFIEAYVENWLKHAGELRKNELEKSRAEILDQFKKIEKQSPECAIAVKLEFRTLTHDFDDLCKIAEQSDAKNLTEVLTLLSKQIYYDAPQLCSESGHPTTQQAIDDALHLSNKRFARLSRYPVRKADSNAQDRVRRVCEFEKAVAKDIIKCQRILAQEVQANMERLKKEGETLGETRFIEKLPQTGSGRVTTRKRIINVAISSDKRTEMASYRRRKVRTSESEQRTEDCDKEGKACHAAVYQKCETQQSEGSRTTQQQEVSNQERKRQEQGVALQRELEAQRQEAVRDYEPSDAKWQKLALQDWKQQHEQQHEAIKECESHILQQEQVEEAFNLERQASRPSAFFVQCQKLILPRRKQGSVDLERQQSPHWQQAIQDQEGLAFEQREREAADERHEVSTEDINITVCGEPSDSQHQSESLQLPTKDTNIAMGGEPSADPLQLECLVKISEATDRNTTLMELLVNCKTPVQHRVTEATTPFTTPQDLSGKTALIKHVKKSRRFRMSAQPTDQKSADELEHRDEIRKHVRAMMGWTRNDKAEPAPKEAVNKYKSTGKEEDGPSKDRFQADFSEARPEKSPWNIRLAEIFVDDYVQGGCPVGRVEDISDSFFTYLRSLRTDHRNRTMANSRGTVHSDASKRAKIDKRKILRFRDQLSALHYHALHRFVNPLTEMSCVVLSDDETDHENGTNLGRTRYAIVKEEWRSGELIKWLRMIDLLAFGEKCDKRIVAQRVNGRRHRVHSTRSKDGTAVAGLPENCYDPGWLSSLKEYERKLLKVKPPLDMTFSEGEQLLAAQYIPLTKGEARPLTNPNTNPDADGLDEWLLNSFGKVRDQ